MRRLSSELATGLPKLLVDGAGHVDAGGEVRIAQHQGDGAEVAEVDCGVAFNGCAFGYAADRCVIYLLAVASSATTDGISTKSEGSLSRGIDLAIGAAQWRE